VISSASIAPAFEEAHLLSQSAELRALGLQAALSFSVSSTVFIGCTLGAPPAVRIGPAGSSVNVDLNEWGHYSAAILNLRRRRRILARLE
jgi:hypothetical protein